MLEAIENWERDTLANDIARGDPDVIVVQRAPEDWLPWARANASIDKALGEYAPDGRRRIGGMRVTYPLEFELGRKKSAAPAP